MPVGAFTPYNDGKERFGNGTIDWDTDAITAVLCTASYTPAATHSTYSDVSATECADGDYAQQQVGTKTVSETGGTVTLDSADISFGNPVTITAKYLIFVKGTAASLIAGSELFGYVNLDTGGGSVSSTASEFTVTTPSGILTF